MNPFFQAVLGRDIKATAYDSKFLQEQQQQKAILGVDHLGRTNYLSTSTVGNSSIQWLGQSKESYTRDGYAHNALAYSVISYILTTSNSIPWNVYNLTVKDGNRQVVTGQQLSNLVYRPNPKQSWGEFKTAVFGYLLTTGNAFIYANRLENGANSGKAGELWVLPAHTEVLGGGHMAEVTGYQVRRADGQFDSYLAEDVLHLKYWNPEDSRYGLSPIQAGYKLVTSANSGLDVRVKQYQNAGPAGILYNNSTKDEVEPVDATTSNAISRKIASFFTSKRAYTVPYLDTKVGYLQLGLSPVDLQVLEALNADKNGIADLFHFPAHLLNGANGSTFNNVGEASKSLYTKCIIPLETQLRDGLNHFLGRDYQDKLYIDYDLSGIQELQENKKELAEWLALCPFVKWKDKQKLMGVEVDETLDFYVLADNSIVSEKPLKLIVTPASKVSKETQAVA